MSVAVPAPLARAYLVGVVNCQSPTTTPAYQNPAYRTAMTFTFTDPLRAGKCLAALCRVSTIRDALTAALSSGYAPSQSPAVGDVYLGGMCRPGDMWACVLYDSVLEYNPKQHKIRRVPSAQPPRVLYGVHADLQKSILELHEVSRDDAVSQNESFFLCAHMIQLG